MVKNNRATFNTEMLNVAILSPRSNMRLKLSFAFCNAQLYPIVHSDTQFSPNLKFSFDRNKKFLV